MSTMLIQSDTLSTIADAIRDKLGVQTEYLPSEMPGAIESITGGGSSSEAVRVWTNSTGGIDASLYIQHGTYENGSFVGDSEVQTLLYSDATSADVEYYGLISIRYNSGQTMWVLKSLIDDLDIVHYTGDEIASWNYANTANIISRRCGGSSGGSLIRLFSGHETRYKSDAAGRAQSFEEYVEGADFGDYLSTTDHATYTVLQSFRALVTVGVMQDPDRSSNNIPNCCFSVNGSTKQTVSSPSATSGSQGIGTFICDFVQKDTFYWGSTNSYGYPVRLGAIDVLDGYEYPDWD